GVVRFNSPEVPQQWVSKIRSGPDGALWFATAGGLYRYEEKAFVNYGKSDGLPEGGVMASTASRDGSIWFASQGSFLVRMKPGSTNAAEKRFVNASEEGFSKTGVFGIEPDAHGGLWIGGIPPLGGVYYYESSSALGELEHFRRLPEGIRLNSGF